MYWPGGLNLKLLKWYSVGKLFPDYLQEASEDSDQQIRFLKPSTRRDKNSDQLQGLPRAAVTPPWASPASSKTTSYSLGGGAALPGRVLSPLVPCKEEKCQDDKLLDGGVYSRDLK